MSTVANILIKKGPQFNMLEFGTSVIHALSLMKSENSSYVIVTQNGNYAGLFSERDYTQKVVLMGKDPQQTTIGEVMTANLPHVTPEGSIARCMMLMTSYTTRYLPVFEDFSFKGVITMKDLVKEMIESVDMVKDAEREFAY